MMSPGTMPPRDDVPRDDVPRVALAGAGGSGGAVLDGHSEDIPPTPVTGGSCAFAKERERFLWEVLVGVPEPITPNFPQGIWAGTVVAVTCGQYWL